MATGSDRGGAGAQSDTVVITGAAGELGRRVCQLVVADPAVARVVALDRRPLRRLPAGVERHQLELATADLKPLFEGASTVLHLAQVDTTGSAPGQPGGAESALAQRVLDAAGAVGAEHVVVLSSALVYGAWANNPVPLTEDAPLRPNPGVGLAAEKAEVERRTAEWRAEHPGATATVLRPTVAVCDGANGWLAGALDRSSPLPVTDDDPPAQYVEVADLAAAVDLARRERLDGPRNVAPDGWISGDTVRALAGGPPRVRLPERLALRLAGLRWRWGLTPTPPELLPYTVHSWVIANDRLKADGWTPSSSNEEAYVAAHRAGRWATISPRRRQELALGAAGVALVGVAAAGVVLVRRAARRRG
jgi:nucleoside-diphosphate-sugar epimerase